MGCNVCLWLLISLGRVWGMGHGAREMVLGTLGKATILRIPPELQNLTKHFGEAVWKRDTEDPQRKLVLLKYVDGNYTNYMQGRTRFHKSDFSLEILNTSRQDRQLYEYLVSKGPEEKVWQIQLEVYEPVSDPSIQILDWVLANSSCTITLNCTAERGDNVSYSWGSQDTSTSGLCSHNGSLLHLSYSLQNASIACACTASNPVSSQVIPFDSSECSYEQGGSTRLRTEHLVLMVVVPIAAVMMLTAFVATHLAMPVASQEQERAEDSTVHTIYSQVQRVEKQKGTPLTKHPSCTTIYAAATGLPPDTAPAPSRAPHPPRSPSAEPPTLQGHPPLSPSPDKELTTVYASVMMPIA
ncbi:signaling lymphocytic activation molecule isoform X1 [Grus americana]|uniref:signaling lymphocytic activation molecule isoform X1 n=1 Tax=Grus americana TaxID=9117 RepID=UPI002407BA86|nr:signaling lymphocytic activation molecule isoform X1 [Grus americana]